MIQRIQTIYLILTIVFTFLLIKFPVIENVLRASEEYRENVENLFSQSEPSSLSGKKEYAMINTIHLYNVWQLLTLAILSILVSCATIYYFKKRPLQIKLCAVNLLIIICFYIILGWYYGTLQPEFPANATVSLKWTVIIPAVNIALIGLAVRAILKDEALVKATDRLR